MKATLVTASALSMLLIQSVYAAEPAVNVSGVVEVEMASVDGDSDIATATVEVALDAQINQTVSASVVLLHEEDDTPFGVDSASITYAPKDASWSMTAGQIFLPFAALETNLVSDPLTLEIAEILESAVQFDFEAGAINASVYLFNGDDKENKQTSDTADNFGFKVSYTHEGAMNMTAGFSYINDFGNVDGLQNDTQDAASDEYVAGTAIDLMIESGNFSVIVEHVTASDSFEAGELGASAVQPSATNIEIGYSTTVAGKNAVISLAQQSTDEAGVLGLPETRTLLGLSMDIAKATSLGLEYSTEEDYAGNSVDAIVAQLAVEF